MWRSMRGRGQGFSDYPQNIDNRFEGQNQPESQNRGYQNHFRGNFQQKGGTGSGAFRAHKSHSSSKQEMQQELSKPWVNLYLKKQILLKFRLKEVTSSSKQLNDIEKFQQQRKTVEQLTKLAREAFFRHHPDQESHWLSILASEHGNVVSHCELCDEDFDNEDALRQHEGEHQTCGLEGCTFTAHARELEDHIFALHASGLYRRMQVGNTPEEIAKWKADRKKNYPSVDKTLASALKRKQIRNEKHQNYLARLEHQKKIKEERERQREESESKKRKETEDGKDFIAGTKRKRTKNQRCKGSNNEAQLGESQDHSERRKRSGYVFSEDEDDGDRNGNLIKFCGTAFYISARKEFETKACQDDGVLPKDDLDISDDDDWTNWNEKSHETTDHEDKNEAETSSLSQSAIVHDALDDASNAVVDKVDNLNPICDVNDDCDNNQPIPTPIVKVQPQVEDANHQESAEVGSDDDEAPTEVPICKEALAELEPEPHQATQQQSKPKPKNSDQPKFKLVRKPRRNPTLLENLLSSEISSEHSEILQCVKYVCDNKFFGIGNK